jgi:putative PIG3 family NAD(P)H quinone oxidoreductase
MRAVVLAAHGGLEVLVVREVPAPTPAPDEVRVAVQTTAVNRADVLQRMGLYPDPFPGPHEIPGLEYAGVVESVGARVAGRRPGDEVMGIVSGGGYAEMLCVHERQTVRVPRGVALGDAGALPEVFVTAWDALVVQGGLASGCAALVHAGGSGVGTAAIQLCRAVGARVIVTCSAPKRAACLALGAHAAVDHRTEDFVEVVRRETGGAGVDVVLDVVGGDYAARNVACLAPRGTIVQVGVMGGGDAAVPLGLLMRARGRLVGTVLRPRPLEEKIAISRRFEAEVVPLFESGALAPVIDRRYRLEEMADAHRRMEANENVGKIVIDVR